MMSNHHQNDVPVVPSKNAYIALREAKIARNEERLRVLGLLTTTTIKNKSHPPPSRKRQAPRQQPAVTRRPRRQSARLRASSRPVNYTEESSSSSSSSIATRLQRTTAKHNSKPLSVQQLRKQLEEQQEKGSAAAAAAVVTPENDDNRSTLIQMIPSSHSARAIKLNVQKLLEPEQPQQTSSSNDGSILGVPLARTGKAHVMQESARRAAVGETAAATTTATTISFNKYAGIQEWGDDEATNSDATMFLWVNLGAPHCDVVNEFRAGGRQVVFYGGARMHDGSRVIQKLVRVGMAAAAAAADPPSSSNSKKNHPGGGVVLWCRPYLAQRKTFGPYVCLGRLSVSVSSHVFICRIWWGWLASPRVCPPSAASTVAVLFLRTSNAFFLSCALSKSWCRTIQRRSHWSLFGTCWITTG